MITEDYCSFEVAKLLKDKGFVEPCLYYYFSNGIKMYKSKGIRHRNSSSVSTYSAPTHQMAMKWLREVHNIIVSPYALSLGYYFEIFDLTTKDITGCKSLYKSGIPSKEYVLSTYEDAVEAALKYCLENLI